MARERDRLSPSGAMADRAREQYLSTHADVLRRNGIISFIVPDLCRLVRRSKVRRPSAFGYTISVHSRARFVFLLSGTVFESVQGSAPCVTTHDSNACVKPGNRP